MIIVIGIIYESVGCRRTKMRKMRWEKSQFTVANAGIRAGTSSGHPYLDPNAVFQDRRKLANTRAVVFVNEVSPHQVSPQK